MLHMEGIDGRGYVVVQRNVGRATLQRIAAVLGRSQHATKHAALFRRIWRRLTRSGHSYVEIESCKVRCKDGHQLWIKVSLTGAGAVDIPLGVWRKARVVLTAPKPVPMTAFEIQCVSAIDLVKDAYLKLIASPFTITLHAHPPSRSGRCKRVCGRVCGSNVHLNPVLWDFKVSLVSSFIKLLVEECGRSDVPLEQGFAMGFHGTPAGNTANILQNGFDPSKNVCRKAGAFFSGSFDRALRHGIKGNCRSASDVSVLIVALVCGRELHGTSLACDELRRMKARKVALPETHTLPLASIRF